MLRLIVLVPNRGINTAKLARRVWNLAASCEIPVLFVGLAGRAEGEETGARLRLITLASMTRDERLSVETYVAPGANWLAAIRPIARPGDVVICMMGHTVRVRGQGDLPLSLVCERALGLPAYVLADLGEERRPVQRARVTQTLARWLYPALPFLLVVVLFLAQVRIDLTTHGALRILLLCVSNLAGIGLIGVWSAWAG